MNKEQNVEPTSVSPAIAKPFVSRSTFYQGDCLVEMDKIADKSVDMILCDLPYGTTACKWDSVIPFDALWKHYERIIKDNGAIVLTAQQPFTTALISSKIGLFRYEIIWDKMKGGNFLQANKMPLRQHENILVFYKSLPTYNPIMKNADADKIRPLRKNTEQNSENYLAVKNGVEGRGDTTKRFPTSILPFSSMMGDCNPLNRKHPTQKPIELFEWFVKTYTNEGETVLDNCMGSGSTGVACKKTGRNFIGIEKDEKYFEIAVSRVSAYCG